MRGGGNSGGGGGGGGSGGGGDEDAGGGGGGGELEYQLHELDLLTRQHHTLQKHVQEKDLECVSLKDKLKLKNELCQGLVSWVRVVIKPGELTESCGKSW